MSIISFRFLSRGLVAYLLGFLIFLGIGFFTYEKPVQRQSHDPYYFSDSDFETGFGRWKNFNIASSKRGSSVKEGLSTPSDINVVDQKYQKVASVGSTTSSYPETVDSVKALIKGYKGLIQYEENSGLQGNRLVRMAIGIQPADFEQALAKLKGIGKLEYFRSDVRDKTNEFRTLQAKRKTLTAHLNSLTDFKSRDGKIEELIDLQSKILNVQEQLQGLGVSLGDFDSENEFCTIKLTVKEITKAQEIVVTTGRKLRYAFDWAISNYLMFTFIALLFTAAAFLLIRIVEKVNTLKRDSTKID